MLYYIGLLAGVNDPEVHHLFASPTHPTLVYQRSLCVPHVPRQAASADLLAFVNDPVVKPVLPKAPAPPVERSLSPCFSFTKCKPWRWCRCPARISCHLEQLVQLQRHPLFACAAWSRRKRPFQLRMQPWTLLTSVRAVHSRQRTDSGLDLRFKSTSTWHQQSSGSASPVMPPKTAKPAFSLCGTIGFISAWKCHVLSISLLSSVQQTLKP